MYWARLLRASHFLLLVLGRHQGVLGPASLLLCAFPFHSCLSIEFVCMYKAQHPFVLLQGGFQRTAATAAAIAWARSWGQCRAARRGRADGHASWAPHARHHGRASRDAITHGSQHASARNRRRRGRLRNASAHATWHARHVRAHAPWHAYAPLDDGLADAGNAVTKTRKN